MKEHECVQHTAKHRISVVVLPNLATIQANAPLSTNPDIVRIINTELQGDTL